MKAIKVTITAYDYWKTMDRDGYVTIEKYFATKETAEQWIAEHQNYIFRGCDKTHTKAEYPHEKPTFRTEEIDIA